AREAIDQHLARYEQVLECDRARDAVIVEKTRDRAARAITMEVAIRLARIDAAAGDAAPRARAVAFQRTHALRLMWRQNDVRHPRIDQRAEGRVVGGGLGQP